MIERSEKIYNTSEYHHLSQKNPHLSIKLEKHGISLPFITPAKVSQAHLWYLHSLITSCETFPPMCRNTPGVSLLLQDGRTERDGWGGDSHPRQGSSAFTLTHTHTQKSKRTCSSSPQVRFCSRCGSCKCQQGSLMKFLSFASFPLSPKPEASPAGNSFPLRTRKRREASRENHKEWIHREFTL